MEPKSIVPGFARADSREPALSEVEGATVPTWFIYFLNCWSIST
jgi:hypothetical protein